MFVKSSILLAFVIAGALATSTELKDCKVDEAELMMVDGSDCMPLSNEGVNLTATVTSSRRRRAADDEVETETQTIQLTDNAVLVINRPKAPVNEVEPKEIDTPVTPLESCVYNVEGVTLSACKPLIIHRLQTAFGNVTSIQIGEAALAKLGDDDKDIIKRETTLNIPEENEIVEECEMVLMGVEMKCEPVAVITEKDEEGEKIVTVTVAEPISEEINEVAEPNEPVSVEVADEDTTVLRRRRSDEQTECEAAGKSFNTETNECVEVVRRRRSAEQTECEAAGKSFNTETNECVEVVRRRRSAEQTECEAAGKSFNTETNECVEVVRRRRSAEQTECEAAGKSFNTETNECVEVVRRRRASESDNLTEEETTEKADCEADALNEWTREFGCMLKPTTTPSSVMTVRRKRDAEAAKEEDSKPATTVATLTTSEEFSEEVEFVEPVAVEEETTAAATEVTTTDL